MKGILFWLTMLVFCVLCWFSVYCGFKQVFTKPEVKQDSLTVKVDRLERKINVILPNFQQAGVEYNFEEIYCDTLHNEYTIKENNFEVLE